MKQKLMEFERIKKEAANANSKLSKLLKADDVRVDETIQVKASDTSIVAPSEENEANVTRLVFNVQIYSGLLKFKNGIEIVD